MFVEILRPPVAWLSSDSDVYPVGRVVVLVIGQRHALGCFQGGWTYGADILNVVVIGLVLEMLELVGASDGDDGDLAELCGFAGGGWSWCENQIN